MTNEDITQIEIYRKLEKHDNDISDIKDEIHIMNEKLDPIFSTIKSTKRLIVGFVGSSAVVLAIMQWGEFFTWISS